ncbi:MAG: MMPL family transporter, partial [Tistlia sp.]
MNRSGVLLLVAALLSAIAAVLVEVANDAEAILAPETLALDALDTAAGRSFVVALESPDRAARSRSARAIAELLAEDPLVASVNEGPLAPSEAFLDWLWEQRFRLAPPEPQDLTVAALRQRLAEARASLSGADGFLFGDRLLRDPTGSFARLLQRFSGSSQELRHEDGIWQSRDDRAALLFVTLADRSFVTAEVAALSDRIRAESAAGVTPHLLGPRLVSAEIGRETAREATRAALLAGALLLAWLAWTLRSLRALALAVLPLACGLAAACLAVQLLFGSVHVIALGFGGVLAGLALDYPLHLLGHPGAARPGAERLVLLGALTTAVGFLAMLGSGVPALMQT